MQLVWRKKDTHPLWFKSLSEKFQALFGFRLFSSQIDPGAAGQCGTVTRGHERLEWGTFVAVPAGAAVCSAAGAAGAAAAAAAAWPCRHGRGSVKASQHAAVVIYYFL